MIVGFRSRLREDVNHARPVDELDGGDLQRQLGQEPLPHARVVEARAV